jgi:hypothetical protein
MPFGDGTGPRGLGAMTGRVAGFCAGFGRPGFANPIPGRWFGGGYGAPVSAGFGLGFGGGFGRGRGFGRGWRRWGGYYDYPGW